MHNLNEKRKNTATRASSFGLILLAGGLLLSSKLNAQSGPRPGATNPIGSTDKMTLFPDDEVFSFSPDGNGKGDIVTRFYRTNKSSDLSLADASSLKVYGNHNSIAAASGRMLDPGRASVAWVQRVPGTSQMQMRLFDTDLHERGSDSPLIIGTDLRDRSPSSGSSTADQVAVATGDLDQALDSNDNYHDEVAVVYQSQTSVPNEYKLAVLNYANWTPQNPVVSEATLNVNDRGYGFSQIYPDVSVAVAIGDFNGDGKNEIAFGYLGQQYLCVAQIGYTSDGHGGGSLQDLNKTICVYYGGGYGSLSLQAGDFNGDGVDELAVGYNVGNNPTLAIWTLKGSPQPTVMYNLPAMPGGNGTKVQVAAGQFLFDPTKNINFGQKQVAIAWNDSAKQAIDIQLFSVSSDLKTLTPIGSTAYAKTDPAWQATPTYLFSLAAGGFRGKDGPTPTASLVVSAWTPWGVSKGAYWIRTIAVSSSGLTFASLRSFETGPVDNLYRVPVLAADVDGKSVFLGAPAHITVQNAVSTDYILEEPPKHSFWDGTQMVNVSNTGSNAVTFSYKTGTSSSSQSADQVNWSNGTSTAVSAGATFGYSKNFLIGSASAEISADITKKGSSVYNQNQNSYNSQYGSRTFTITSKTDSDDYLYGRLQTIDIWRFRMYGITQSNPQLNNFYDVVLPGPTIPYNGGGRGFDWYQPIHENGNILTYPQRFNAGSNNPPDLGSYKDADGKTVTAPIVPMSQWTFDGTSGTQQLDLSTAGGSGHTVEYGRELSSSLDISVGFKASAEVGGFSGEVRASGSLEFSNNSSWANTQTSDTTTTTETSVALNKAAGDHSQAYSFNPLVYITRDGTFKMSFAAPNPSVSGSGANFWASTFGHSPDPALNLSYRFTPTSSTPAGWQPNVVSTRKQMRGMFFRKAAQNPLTKTYELMRNAAVDGDQVRIEARVYNESTAQGSDNITVKFQKIPYDSSTDNEICTSPINAGVLGGQLCPASARTDIGQTTISHLNPLQFTCIAGIDDPGATGCLNTPVFINWNTTGSGPANAGGTGAYRIYVVLQPSNPTELYGLDGAPVAIQSITNAGPITIMTVGPHGLHTGDYITLGAPGLKFPQTTRNIFQATYVSDTSFTLNGTTDVPGTYTGGGTVTPLNPGQNDEGYFRFDVQNAPTQIAPDKGQPADSLAADSVQALDPVTGQLNSQNNLAGGNLAAKVNQPIRIRVGVFSLAPHPDGETLLLFDGDPSTGAPAIASQLVHPGDNNGQGTYAWFDWTPTTAGTHNLYAKLLSGQGTSMLPVSVQ